MENRITITDCTKEKFDRFVSEVNKISTVINRKPANAKTPQDRLTLGFNNDRVSVVWESKSQKLILTASEGSLNAVKAVYDKESFSSKTTDKIVDKAKQGNNKDNDGNKKSVASSKKTVNKNLNTEKKPERKGLKKASAPITSSKHVLSEDKKTLSIEDILLEEARALGVSKMAVFTESHPKKTETNSSQVKPKKTNSSLTKPSVTSIEKTGQDKLSKANNSAVNDVETSKSTTTKAEKAQKNNGVKDNGSTKKARPAQAKATKKSNKQTQRSVEKVEGQEKSIATTVKLDEQKFKSLINNLKANKKLRTNVVLDNNDRVEVEVIHAKKQALLAFKRAKKTLSIRTSSQELSSIINDIIVKQKDYKQAISSYIKLTGEEKKASVIQKRLKKYLPDAFEFLSEQSKIDLAIGLIDIMNDDVKLSDYSMLLVPPYRGLEKFIYDLQIAQNIEVKLIGQAFEKDAEGKYGLKVGYRRRIKSVVYNEVMSALYTEYYVKRNFYAHSDNSFNSSSRIISQKDQVKQIYLNLLELMNYNSKKLKEIGFSL